MQKSFGNKTIVVVGGGSGIGKQYALDLGRRGADVLVVSHSESAFAVAEEITKSGASAKALVSDAREGEKIVAAAISYTGRIDGLIVNAGVTRDRTFAKMSEDEWDDVLSVHLGASMSCSRAAWAPMSQQGGGRILLTVSGAGLHGSFGQANYAAAKGAIYGLMRTLAIEGAKYGIRANAISPTAATGMTKNLFSKEVADALPAAAISPVALALVHPECPVNGKVIEAGGGWVGTVRWEQSAGRRFEIDDTMFEQIHSQWDDILDFADGSRHPSTTAESLATKIGNLSPFP